MRLALAAGAVFCFFFVCGEMGHGRETCVSPTRGEEIRAGDVDALDDRQPTHAATHGGAE